MMGNTYKRTRLEDREIGHRVSALSENLQHILVLNVPETQIKPLRDRVKTDVFLLQNEHSFSYWMKKTKTITSLGELNVDGCK